MKQFLPFLFINVLLHHSLFATDSTNCIIKKNPCYFFNSTSINCDTIPGGPSKTFRFVLHNCSDASININNVKTSCGCLVAKWDYNPIPSGDSSIILATYCTKDRPGYFSKSITVVLENKDCIMLSVKGYTKPKLVPTKKAVWAKREHNFGNLSMGPKASCNFEFTNTSSDTLHIERCFSACGCDICTYVNEPIPPGQMGKVTYLYDTKSLGESGGSFKKSMTGKFSNGEIFVLTATGTVLAKGMCAYFPINLINLDTVKQGESIQAKFDLVNCTDTMLRIIEVRHSSYETIAWDKSPIKPNENRTITVSKKIFNPGLHRKTYQVELNNGDKAAIEIKVYVRKVD